MISLVVVYLCLFYFLKPSSECFHKLKNGFLFSFKYLNSVKVCTKMMPLSLLTNFNRHTAFLRVLPPGQAARYPIYALLHCQRIVEVKVVLALNTLSSFKEYSYFLIPTTPPIPPPPAPSNLNPAWAGKESIIDECSIYAERKLTR